MSSIKKQLELLVKQYMTGESRGCCSGSNDKLSDKLVLENIKKFYRNLKWNEALDAAGHAFFAKGKRDPHQYRYRDDTLKKVRETLQNNEADLKSTRNFDELYDKVDSIFENITYVGDLMVYDTTLRLWSNLSKKFKSSDRVYLHNGAWEGAKELFQKGFFKTKLQKKMMRAEFPESLQTLPSEHIEHFICVMKSEISKLK